MAVLLKYVWILTSVVDSFIKAPEICLHLHTNC